MEIKNTTKRAQVIIEYTFCMIIVFLMIYAAIKIFRWTGLDLAERRKNHDAVLISNIDRNDGSTGGPLKQIDPYFSRPIKMNTIWDGS